MIKIDHPDIIKMERDGYLEEDEPVFYDSRNVPVYLYDEYLELDDFRFKEDGMFIETIEVLISLGATKKVCTRDEVK